MTHGWPKAAAAPVEQKKGGHGHGSSAPLPAKTLAILFAVAALAFWFIGAVLLTSAAVSVPKSEVPSLVVLGRLVPHKRVEHAVQVLARLLTGHPASTLKSEWQENAPVIRASIAS